MNTTSGLSKIKSVSSYSVNRGRTLDGEPNPIDIHVGLRIRMRRQLLGLSQNKLAEMMGLTFQQIQKYERGQNRMGTSRLWDMSKILNVPVGFFFEDMPTEVAEQSPRCYALQGSLIEAEEATVSSEADPMNRIESYELLHDYYRITNRKLAKGLKNIIHESARNYYDVSQDENEEEKLLLEHEIEQKEVK